MTALSFLTWNLAMLDRSDEAPPSWEQSDTEAAVRDAVLAIQPDVVCLQELPGIVPFVETHTMLPATPTSHSGNLATLLTPQARDAVTSAAVIGDFAIAATFEDQITVVNVHLVSGRAGERRRREQLARVVEASPTDALVIVGDTNTRVGEIDRICDELGVTGRQPQRPTWDGRRNKFRFDAPAYTAYFTRYFATPDVVVDDVAVHDLRVEHGGYRFHLSDHHALSARVAVGQTGLR